MDRKIHTLIVGEQGVGKSTLIRRVLEALDVPVCGYVTRKEDGLADPQLGSPIYIYEAGQPYRQSEENLVGHCKDQRPVVYPEAFDRFAVKLQALQGAQSQNAESQSAESQSAESQGAEQECCGFQALAQDHGLILLDEIGTMETRSEDFCQAVLKLLDGEVPILAAVKYKDRPFLQQVRSHPCCRCFNITEQNRNELFEEVLAFVREQLR